MSGTGKSLDQTLAGKEFAGFLRDFSCTLRLDYDGTRFSCTVVECADFLLAFTYAAGLGENFYLAELGTPVAPDDIENRKHGWRLVGEVWPSAYDELHETRMALPYPHQLSREEQAMIMDRLLRRLVPMIRSGELSVRHPISPLPEE